MKFDEETLIEIEDYIQALDEQVGLKPETVIDINKAIGKQRGLVKKLAIPDVVWRSEQLVCYCPIPSTTMELPHRCIKCNKPIKWD